MPLTDLSIRNAKPGPRLQKLSDGRGLQLHITPAGSKLWRWAYRFDGKQKLMALGIYPDVSLAQARQAATEARALLATGTDPMEQRKADKLKHERSIENTIEIIARKWCAHWSPARSARHAEYVIRRLEADVFPSLGMRLVDEIQAPEVVTMVKAIEERGALDIAKRSLQTCGQIFRYAIAHGYATRNPATDIRPGDILTVRKKQNYARLDAKELPDLLRHIVRARSVPS